MALGRCSSRAQGFRARQPAHLVVVTTDVIWPLGPTFTVVVVSIRHVMTLMTAKTASPTASMMPPSKAISGGVASGPSTSPYTGIE